MHDQMDERRSELENMHFDVEKVDLEGSEVEHKEVEKVVGVDPGEGNVETIRHKWVTDDGSQYFVVVKKRFQCKNCDRIIVEEPVAPGSCPECGEDFWEEELFFEGAG